MTWTATQQVEVTGHNREARGVVHYLRPIINNGQQLEFQGGIIITDDKNIIPDGTLLSLSITASEVKPNKG